MTPWQQCEVETAYLFNVCAPNLRGKRRPQGPTLMFRVGGGKARWDITASFLQRFDVAFCFTTRNALCNLHRCQCYILAIDRKLWATIHLQASLVRPLLELVCFFNVRLLNARYAFLAGLEGRCGK